jgi:catechol 2,3-dioxygenase-like lactoylglutathione lyase family enzyme
VPGAVGFWIERFIRHHVEFEHPKTRFDEERVIAFKDPDGFMGELVAHPGAEARQGHESEHIPASHSIRGIYSVTLWQESCDLTGKLLVESLGFEPVREQASIFRYAAKDRGTGSIVDLRCVPGLWAGSLGAGTIHHVAFRAPDNAAQLAVRNELVEKGFNVTPQIDRDYFQSIYFREPGGVLFEIATDPPGFTVDEPLDRLGQSLKLPKWLEPRRFEIEALLPNIRPPMEIRGPNA